MVAPWAWDLHKNIYTVEGTHVQVCGKFFRPPNRNTQGKCVASRSDCQAEDREFVVGSGSSLHMMSKDALTAVEKETRRTSGNVTVIMTANGKSGSTEEATVYVSDLDVCVTMMLLEDSPVVLSLGNMCEDMGYSYEWTKGESPSLIKYNKIVRCRCQIVAVPKESRKPDVLAKASGDRLRIPGSLSIRKLVAQGSGVASTF